MSYPLSTGEVGWRQGGIPEYYPQTIVSRDLIPEQWPLTTQIKNKGNLIQRAAHGIATAIKHMGIDLRRADILMSQKLLHSTNVITVFQQVRSK